MALAVRTEPGPNPRRAAAGIVAALVAAGVVLVLPASDALPAAAQRLAGLFVLCLVLWVTEAIPIAVTSLLALALQPVFGVARLQTAFAGFISTVFFFVIAMFCIAQAVISSGLDRRFALWLLARAGTDSRRVLFAFLAGTAALSAIVSDVPCTAIFMAVALGLFERMGVRPGESEFARSVMMGIPIAAFIGGIGTPAGSSINILGLGFIEEFGNVTVPFLHWMAIGIPMVIILIPVAWWALLRFYPPEIAVVGGMDAIAAERAELGSIRAREAKVLVVLGAMFTLWITSTWIPALDVAQIALLGAATMFLPGIGLLTWREVERSTGWDVLLMIGSVTSLGAASAETGLAKWMVDASLGGLAGEVAWIVAAISAFTVLIHLVLPIGPVIVAVIVPPIVLLAAESGANPALYALPVVFSASCAFLLPLDAVPLVTYAKGYYRMLDMLKPGLVISAAWIVVMTVLLTLLGPALGLF